MAAEEAFTHIKRVQEEQGTSVLSDHSNCSERHALYLLRSKV